MWPTYSESWVRESVSKKKSFSHADNEYADNEYADMRICAYRYFLHLVMRIMRMFKQNYADVYAHK